LNREALDRSLIDFKCFGTRAHSAKNLGGPLPSSNGRFGDDRERSVRFAVSLPARRSKSNKANNRARSIHASKPGAVCGTPFVAAITAQFSFGDFGEGGEFYNSRAMSAWHATRSQWKH
jgi:hypothetical protein